MYTLASFLRGVLLSRRIFPVAAIFAVALMWPSQARATEYLCDSSVFAQTQNGVSVSDCRQPLLALIDKESVGIDVAFWFMEDQRYMNHIITRWKAGVPVRLIVDPRANPTYALNAETLQKFRDAGIPMIKKPGGGIMHWKTMVFAGQNTVEFGSANYSPDAFVPTANYTNYVAETIYFSDDPAIVNSFKRKFDDLWVDTTNYVVDSNVASRTRVYPVYTISPDLNFPPYTSSSPVSGEPRQGFATRLISLEKSETQKIDVIMYRITQQSQSDALIAAFKRGVPVRYLGETREYRDISRLWVAWNMDRMYAAGIPMRVRKSLGENHEKLVLLYGQAMSVFGSSNFTGPSDNSQQEHNYFTKKPWMFTWFTDQFERKWNNSTGNAETTPFVPLPPDTPSKPSIASGATAVPTTGQKLGWYGGPWAHVYDIYFGTDSSANTLLAANQSLGPSETTTQKQSFALPPLQPGTTYYWKIVSKTAAWNTAANVSKTGPIWNFTTTGNAPPPSAGTVVLWTSSTPATDIHGNWPLITDSTAAGGKVLQNTDQAAAKISPALASPANYFELSFSASSGMPYHLWLRMRAQNNSLGNDSVHVQFSDSLTGAGGSATMRIGTTSSAEVVLQNGSSGSAPHNWGWADNGWGVPGVQIYFASTGTHTLRIQQREDGAIVDQVILSPDSYLNGPPGARLDDTTILQPAGGATGGGGTGGGGGGTGGGGTGGAGTGSLGAGDVLLHPAAATNIVGEWAPKADSTAATGQSLLNTDHGAAKITTASATPANYFEMTFDAAAGTSYHLWMRGKATSNSYYNDSVFIQFSDSVDGNGASVYRIGTTSAAEYNLEDCSGCGIAGWGWQDNAYGVGVQAVLIRFATSGTHTLRIQVREDGLVIDQILLSPQKYLTQSPGLLKNDTTILQ